MESKILDLVTYVLFGMWCLVFLGGICSFVFWLKRCFEEPELSDYDEILSRKD